MGCVIAVFAFIWKLIKTVIKIAMKVAELIIKMLVGLGLVLPMIASIVLLALWVFGIIVAGTPLFIVLWSLLGVFTLAAFIFHIVKLFRKDNNKNNSQNETNRYNQNDNNRYYENDDRYRDERYSDEREEKKSKRWWQ